MRKFCCIIKHQTIKNIVIQEGVCLDNNICGIYKIVNVTNSKVYIGQSNNIKKRWTEHRPALNHNRHINVHLQNACNKYGEKNFEFDIIEECCQEQLNILESKYIKEYQSYDSKFGYNKTFGGDSIVFTEEIKRKRSKSLSGENNPMYGKTGPLNPAYKRQKSDNEIKRLKDSWTKERRANQSKNMSGKNNPMHNRCGDLNHASRKVMCIETGQVFNTVTEATKWAGLASNVNITMVCRGDRKRAGRHPATNQLLHWQYV